MSHKDEQKGNKSKKRLFQKVCGQALLELQKYKLKSNLIECSMSKKEVQKYLSYYINKSKKRLEYSIKKVKQLSQIFETNQQYLQGLQLKSINNMIHAFKQRINNSKPINSTKYSNSQQILVQAILQHDQSKTIQIQTLLNELKEQQDKDNSQILQEDDDKMGIINRISYEEALKLINKSEVQNHRCFQDFQRSIANMSNQLCSYLQKLVQFYNVWDNLGSSLIYEIKCQREVAIDTALNTQTSHTTQQIQQPYPYFHKSSTILQQQIKNNQSGQHQYYQNTTLTNPNTDTDNRKTNNIKMSNKLIQKLSCYETSNNKQMRQCLFDDCVQLREQEHGFFRYTYEQLQHQTKQYLQQANRNQEAMGHQRDTNFDKFYVYCDKQQIKRVKNRIQLVKHNVSPQMNVNCWYDRLGYQDTFSILDFPANLLQRKLQFEYDRHNEMQQMNERRRQQYNEKQLRLRTIDNQNITNKQVSQTTKMHIKQEQHPKITNQKSEQNPKQNQPKQRYDKNDINKQIKNDITQQQNISNQIKITKNPNNKGSKYEIQKFEQQIQQILRNKKRPYQSRQQMEQKQKQKQKQKQPLQMFTIRYLPEYQKQILRKVKLKMDKLGLGQEQIQPVSFGYLPDYQIPAIKQCLFMGKKDKQQEGNIKKTYIMSKHMYIKIQPLFFHNRTKMFKIVIHLVTLINQLQQLKSNFQAVLSNYGKCAFYINSELISPETNDDSKLYILIGSLLQNIKQDRNTKDILKNESKHTIDLQHLLQQGKNPYQSFVLHYETCKNL